MRHALMPTQNAAHQDKAKNGYLWRRAGQHLRDMHHLNGRVHAAEFALDIHQTAHITADHDIRSGVDNVFYLVGYHCI